MRRAITIPCSVEGCEAFARSGRDPMCNVHRHRLSYYGSLEDPSESRRCDFCGSEFHTTRKRARFCREACRRSQEKADRASENAARCRIWVGECVVCGQAFVSPKADGPQERACSDACRAERKRSRNKDRYRELAEEMPRRVRYPESAAANDARRRVEAHAVTLLEPFSRSEIGDRDGWVCQLCGKPIDRSLVWPDPGSQSLDHKTPLSKGGSHSRENCQITHLRCNLSKGNRE